MNKKRSIKEVVKELGLPKGTQFDGFIVHLPESDEFLAMSIEDEYSEQRAWIPMPDMAHRYKSQEEAEAEVKKYDKGAVVCLLFDTGDQYIVSLP